MMLGFIKDLFSRKQSDPEIKQTDFEAHERAGRVYQCLIELFQLPPTMRQPNLLVTQAALIYRLQQDVYKIFGVNLAKPQTFFESHDTIAAYLKAFEAVENQSRQCHKSWVKQKAEDDTLGTVVGGMMTHACEFWVTALFASGDRIFAPLQLCVQNNHLIIASVPKAEVMAEAGQYKDLFFNTGDYPLQESHWPYVDLDRIIQEYREIVNTDGPLADQFLRLLRARD